MDAKDVAASPDLLYLQILGLGVLLNVGEAERNSSLWSVLVAKIAVILNIDQRKMVRRVSLVGLSPDESTGGLQELWIKEGHRSQRQSFIMTKDRKDVPNIRLSP